MFVSGADTVEEARRRLQILEVREREVVDPAGLAGRVADADRHNPIGVGERQIAQEHAVDEREHGDRRGHADGKRRDSGDSEAAMLPGQSRSEAHVIPHDRDPRVEAVAQSRRVPRIAPASLTIAAHPLSVSGTAYPVGEHALVAQALEEDDVVGGHRARDGEAFAVVRPGEIGDRAAVGEVRELIRRFPSIGRPHTLDNVVSM